jgi:hypothetical protein
MVFGMSKIGNQKIRQRIVRLYRTLKNLKNLHSKQMGTLIQQMTADFACSNLEILGTETVYFLSDAISAPFKVLVPYWIGSNFGYKFPLWLIASGLLTFFIVGLYYLPVGWWNALGGNTANPGWCIGFGFIL